MQELKDLAEKIADAMRDACILENALEFVRANSDDAVSYQDKGLCDTLWVLRHFAEKISDEMTEIDQLTNIFSKCVRKENAA